MFLLAKYNTQTVFTFPMVKAGVRDFAQTADWTPATGDTKISKDGGTTANTTNNPAVGAGTNAAFWSLTLTATELSCGVADVQIIDSATKAVEDQAIKVFTYGNASAKLAVDFSDAVRFGLTALPNAAAEAAGGLFTRGAGAGQVNQAANGQLDANVARVNNVASGATQLQALASRMTVGTVSNAAFSPTGTQFECSDITDAAANFYKNMCVYALTGSLAKQLLGVVTAYSLISGKGHFTVAPGNGTLANGDTVLVL